MTYKYKPSLTKQLLLHHKFSHLSVNIGHLSPQTQQAYLFIDYSLMLVLGSELNNLQMQTPNNYAS